MEVIKNFNVEGDSYTWKFSILWGLKNLLEKCFENKSEATINLDHLLF